jgi:spore coat polysaccharide biosynthesis protein SpsF
MIVAIIQARMGSTRLPGKVLLEVQGQPLLGHVVQRVKQAKMVEQVVVATSEASSNEAIVDFCQQAGVLCFRGSENDVLDRYYQAAKWIQADLIVRVTADCPLIDPTVIDRVVSAHLQGAYDYTSNTLERTYPDGLDTEVFTFAALSRAWQEAKLLSEREHVTPYIWKHDEIFTIQQVTQSQDWSQLRWTVDEPEDLTFAQAVYRHLRYQPERTFLMEDVIELLKAQPELAEINQGFIANEGYLRSLAEDEVVL